MEELEFTTTTVLYRDAGPVIDDVSLTVVPELPLSIRTSHIERCWDSRTNLSCAPQVCRRVFSRRGRESR